MSDVTRLYPICVCLNSISTCLYRHEKGHVQLANSYSYGPRREKTCLRGSNKARLKPVSSATETGLNIENLLVASLDLIISNKRITKALIRLRGCAGWSAPLLLANPEDRFSRVEVPIREWFGRGFVVFLFSVHLN